MIDLAKTLNNDPDMIKFAQIFAQQPRNTVGTICQITGLTLTYNAFCVAHVASRAVLRAGSQKP